MRLIAWLRNPTRDGTEQAVRDGKPVATELRRRFARHPCRIARRIATAPMMVSA